MSAEDYVAALAAKKQACLKRFLLRWDKTIEAARGLVEKCEHAHFDVFEWKHDNGYGMARRKHGHRCVVCGKENRWPGASLLWRTPEPWRD